jgi:glutamine amidotransferase-like uncharacterized protein
LVGKLRTPAAVLLAAAVATGCGPSQPADSNILLFTGTGTSPGDVAAVEGVLQRAGLAYATASSRQLNAMSESRLRTYKLLIVPGGNFIEIGTHLTSTATANVRAAVRSGVNYLGICAGGFLAGETGSNSLNLTSGAKFHFYAEEARGIRKAAVRITDATGRTLEQYWEDGPEFTGWGTVVATYPNGTPAVVEGESGHGWLVLAGVHPEAPQSWRRGITFATPVEADNAYAATLIGAALNRTSLTRR